MAKQKKREKNEGSKSKKSEKNSGIRKWISLEYHEKFKKALPLIIVIILVGSWMFYSFNTEGIVYDLFQLSPGEIQDFLSSMGIYAAVLFFVLVVLEVILAPLIPLVLYVAGGMVFGPLWGGLLVLAGNLVGAYIVFKLVKRYGRAYVEKNISEEKLKRFDNFSSKHGAFSLFLLRLNPLTSSDIFSYIYGLSNISLKKFLLATGLGIAPLIFAQSYFGWKIFETSTSLFPVLVILTVLFLALIVYFLIKELFRKDIWRRN